MSCCANSQVLDGNGWNSTLIEQRLAGLAGMPLRRAWPSLVFLISALL